MGNEHRREAMEGRIPLKWHQKIIDVGRTRRIFLALEDFLTPPQIMAPMTLPPRNLVDEFDEDIEMLPPLPNSPFAKWRGQIDLGGDLLDCYVLDNGQRVIALRSAIKSISGTDSGKLGNYIGVTTLKPFLNSDLILGELIEFSIPGTQFRGKCLAAAAHHGSRMPTPRSSPMTKNTTPSSSSADCSFTSVVSRGDPTLRS